MAESIGRPDLVIAIDFGMTCTGVAYCNISTGSENVRWIQRWPGRTQANENKVPTLLVYPQNSSQPSSWSFIAETAQEQGSPGNDSREWFKIMLDEDLLNKMRAKQSSPGKVPQIHEVEKWYTDYFTLLYQTIEARLKGELASRWEDAKVEYIFSVPTTWKPNPTVERFRRIIERAGFGRYPNHNAILGLTEAEAAAVHTARESPAIFKENDILFVCDVGGGTTDLSVLRVKNTNLYGSISLEQIDVVFGGTIGAAQLDSLFEKAVLEKLEYANHICPMGLEDLPQAAWEMRICKEYQNAKCSFGSEESFTEDTFSVRVPKLDRAYLNDHCSIRAGDMIFKRDDLKPVFDSQISKLFEMMDRQLIRLQQKLPNEEVAHMVLSGGLGNSAYVQDCLRSRYGSGNTPHLNARKLQIRVAPDPQLVVCKGIVADRVAKIKRGQPILGWRCCRASYGTLCKMIYDPNNPEHVGQRTEKDTLDGKLYVVDGIDWFIIKGEAVSSDLPIVRNFRRKCSPATSENPNPTRVFPTSIISSEVEPSSLPMTFDERTCSKVCNVESDFSTLPLSNFKFKNRHWWNFGKKYHRIDFNVRVNIGPADITFELWHQGQKLSRDSTIKVEWQAAPPPDPNQQTDFLDDDFPMNSLPATRESHDFTTGGNKLMRKFAPMMNGASETFGSQIRFH